MELHFEEGQGFLGQRIVLGEESFQIAMDFLELVVLELREQGQE